ncbi:MAG: O-antigen ligase family protein [Muribaculaceae bacterium]|nr:O-antigen ligase family protein [Muribaculaceae bacterium]
MPITYQGRVTKINKRCNLFIKLSYFSLGLSGTAPLLAIVIGGMILSLSTIASLCVFGDLFLGKKIERTNIWKYRLTKYFLYWMGISLLSSFFGLVFFSFIDEQFAFTPLKFIPKILLYLLMLYLLSKQEKSEFRISWLIKGVMFGVWLNIIWSICDAALFYTSGESLTNTLFISYIKAAHIRYDSASLIYGAYIRSSGLNTDPANIGFFTAIGAAYAMISRKFWLILLCVLSALSAVSFVGLVGILLVILYELLFGKSIKHRALFITLGSVLIVGGFLLFKYSNAPTISLVRDAVELKAQSKADGDESTELRTKFITKFPDAIKHLPLSPLIGTGYYTAVYAYYQEGITYNGVYSGKNIPTEMENCYVEYFFDFGLIGLIFFCIFYFNAMRIYQNLSYRINSFENRSIFAIMIGSIISFCFYHYTLYSVVMFTDIAAIVHLRNSFTTTH